MPTTRSSARIASLSQDSGSSQPKPSPATGRKRKTDATGSSPSAKRGKKDEQKQQKTIEDTMETDTPETAEPEVAQNGDAPADDNPEKKEQQTIEQTMKTNSPKEPAKASMQNGDAKDEKKDEKTEATGAAQPEDQAEAKEESKEETREDAQMAEGQNAKPNSTMDDTGTVQPKDDAQKATQEDSSQTNGDAVEPKAREDETPSSILEKGIIYFFFRARVNVEEPHDVNDVARSYIVLRPLPHGAKLTDGPLGDDGNCRIIALPKKVLPLSGKDRFLSFVEKAKTSFKDLKENFLSGADYATKTAGTRHTPAATPLAEGVYALTTTGRESHLAYIITIPSDGLGDVQKDIGLRDRGSFITSVKNPKYPSPAGAGIPTAPDYPQEIIDEFRDLRWMALQPKLLDYANTQFLLIGESGGLDKALQEQPEDEKKGEKETPMQEMEKLEGEDEIRVEGLKGDDAVFADLGLSYKEFHKVPSTW